MKLQRDVAVQHLVQDYYYAVASAHYIFIRAVKISDDSVIDLCIFVYTLNMVTWDEAKRQKTLTERGLDFADAEKVWAGRHFDRTDDRRDYGEQCHLTAGYLAARFVIVTWTMRGGQRRIISMRYGHAEEEKLYQEQMG